MGTVLDYSKEGGGRSFVWSKYLVQVEEAFKGLHPGETQVFVDPGCATSCCTGFEVGKRYLFLTSGGNPIAGNGFLGEAWAAYAPERWRALGHLRSYGTMICIGSRLASSAAKEIEWLRSHARGETKTRVYGFAMQNMRFLETRDVEDGVPVGGALLELSGGGVVWSTRSAADGSFEFAGVPEGEYTVQGAKAPFPRSIPLGARVRAGGCAEVAVPFLSSGTVRGKVLGERVRGQRMRIELVRHNADGSLGKGYLRWADTDRQGGFTLEEVPAGRFRVGIHVVSLPGGEHNYGTSFVDVDVKLDEVVEGIELPEPAALPRRKVAVRVLWENGEPATRGARAELRLLNGWRVDAEDAARNGNVVGLAGIQGEAYRVLAKWMMITKDGLKMAESEWVDLPAGTEDAELTIRLRGNRPVIEAMERAR